MMVSLGVALVEYSKEKWTPKRKWSKRWLVDRTKYAVVNLLTELETNKTCDFLNCLCRDCAVCQKLLIEYDQEGEKIL
jgi:hypothetical protein